MSQVEIEIEVEVGEDTVVALATVELSGEYRPATWEEPAEEQEVQIVSLVCDGNGRELSVGILSRSQCDWLEAQAINTLADREIQ